MDTIGVGLIGTGFMGKCHALAFGAVRAVFAPPLAPRLAVLCDVDADAARRAAADFGFARWTTDWREVVGDPAVGLVAIAAPNALHRAMATAAAAAGKAIYCEKPMALTLPDAATMAEAAAAAGVATLVGYNYLRNPAVVHARRLIAEGAIGEIACFRGVYDEDYMADPDRPYSWRCRVAEAGTGTLGDLACHLVSVAHFLVGPVAAVTADIETVVKRRPDPARPGETAAVENEDLAHALLRFESGVAGTLASSRIAWGRKCRLAWEVVGSRGTIAFDQERMNEIELFVAEGAAARRGFVRVLSGPDHPPYDAFCPAPGHGLGFNDLKVIEVDHLLRGLAGAHPLFPDFGAALAIERVIHGIVLSARRREWVTVGGA